jgi:hypothetical protein
MSKHGKQWNVVTRIDAKKEGAKPFWQIIGRAFESQLGKPGTIKLRLNALPLGSTVYLFLDDGRKRKRLGEPAAAPDAKVPF